MVNEEEILKLTSSEDLIKKVYKLGTLVGWMEFGRNGADVSEHETDMQLIKAELLRRIQANEDKND